MGRNESDERPVTLAVGGDGIARLRLDAPDSGNAIGPAMAAALRDRAGLVTEAVRDDELDARVDALAAALARGPAPAQAAVRRLLVASATAPFAEHLEMEAESIARLAVTPEGREEVAAFVAKRPPDFHAA